MVLYIFGDGSMITAITGGGVSMTDKRDKLVSACKTDPQTCGCLLMYDGWEFKRDYSL